MKIIADENIDGAIIKILRAKKYEVFAIAEKCPGWNDLQVANVVRKIGGVLITEDKDFGEIVFAQHVKDMSVVLLRYDKKKDFPAILENLMNVLKHHIKEYEHTFITITTTKIRIISL